MDSLAVIMGLKAAQDYTSRKNQSYKETAHVYIVYTKPIQLDC